MLEFQNYLRAPSSVQLLLALGEQLKIQSSRLLRGSSLTLTRLNNNNSVIKPAEEMTVIQNLMELTYPQSGGLGLVAGFNHQLTTYGILGYALMSSATGFEAIQLIQRYLALTYTFVKIEFLQDHDQYSIYFTEPLTMSMETKRFVIERAMAATARVIHDIYEGVFELDLFQIKYPESKPSLLSIPEQYLGTKIQFQQKNNVLTFKTLQLQHSLPQANSNTAAMCERLCIELITQRQTILTTTIIVRDFLMNSSNGELLHLDSVANKLNMSERTLKRRLQQENTSFRQIQNETLLQRSNALLSTELSLTQISEILGFSDLSTFSQAYKRWTGTSPSQSKISHSIKQK